MKPIPTDRKILEAIYEEYLSAFEAFSKENKTRSAKIYVPIDIDRIANKLGVDGDIVFGRLYYHLENLYGYKHDDGSSVHFFSPRVGEDIHCVHFPYLASVLANLQEGDRKFRTATIISVVSIIIAIVALIFSVLA